MADDPATVAQLQAELRQLHAQLAASRAENGVLADDLERCKREQAETQEQQTATSEILRVIASSPTDLDRVLHAVAEGAMRQSHSTGSMLNLREGETQRIVAIAGTIPRTPRRYVGAVHPIVRSQASGRAMLDRRTVHLP